jgi:hypothetical protein
LAPNIIGKFKTNVGYKEFAKNFESTKLVLNLKYKPHSLCILPNGNLVTCNSTSLTIFDKYLKQIKFVESTSCLYATTNNKNFIYLTSRVNNEVIKTDLDLNKLLVIGTKGSLMNQFNCPEDIFYYNGKNYVCDHFNKRIQILNEDLTFDASFKIESYPSQIRITNSICCVVATSCIYFYDLNSFILKIKYPVHAAGKISLVFDFYFFKNFGEKFSIFNNEAELIEDIETDDDLKGFINDWSDGCVIKFHNKIIISSCSQSKLVVIEDQKQ